MKVKNINPVEQHVEKGILALCILAAGYLGYTALTSPLKFDPGSGDLVAVRDVEDQISKAVEKMNAMREANRDAVSGMVNRWAKKIDPNQDSNLDSKLLAIRYPALNPGQRIAGTGTITPKQDPTLIPKIVATPLAPKAPVLVEALPPNHFIIKQLDATVAAAPGAAPVPGPGAVAGTNDVVKELKPVKITASYDLKGNFGAMNGVGAAAGGVDIPVEQRIDSDLTKDRVVYLGVEVERVEVNPDQNKAGPDLDWQTLPPNQTEKLAPQTWGDATTTKATLDALHPLRGVILEPRFYQSTSAPASGPAGATPAGGGLLPTTPTGGAGGGGVRVPPPGGGPLPIVPLPTVPPGGTAGGMPVVPPGGAPGAPGAPAADTGPKLSDIPPPAVLDEVSTAIAPIVAYDETAQPGHQYKYRMRVIIANPAYHTDEILKDSGLIQQPTLHSDWSPDSAVFTMEPDQTFYVSAGKTFMAKFKIWQLINAKWQHAEADVPVGEVVNASAKGATPDAEDTVLTTDYMVVDSSPGKVVLMNLKDNKLEVRDVSTDSKAAEKRTLKDKDAADAEAAPKVTVP